MTLAALTWPEASVYVAVIAAVGLVVAVLVWSIFRTGQTAIRSDKRVDNLRRELDELRARLEQSIPSTESGERR
jgi:predicted PurR-regulated permease PerM